MSENLALVKFVVKRFLNRGREYEELYQCGCLGLLKAIDKFDTTYNVAFSTYAVPVIMGEIRRYIRDDGPIRVSRSIKDNARRIDEFAKAKSMDDSCEITVEGICEGLSMDKDDVLLALNSKLPMYSLDEQVLEGDATFKDMLTVSDFSNIEDSILLEQLLDKLTREEKELILKRYFNQNTQTEIARELCISQVQVSRMEKKILMKLRNLSGIQDYGL